MNFVNLFLDHMINLKDLKNLRDLEVEEKFWEDLDLEGSSTLMDPGKIEFLSKMPLSHGKSLKHVHEIVGNVWRKESKYKTSKVHPYNYLFMYAVHERDIDFARCLLKKIPKG